MTAFTLENFRPVTDRDHAAWRAAQPGYWSWLRHVMPAAGCTRPVRLAGALHTVDSATGQVLSTAHTADMPDGVIYKACGNRRETVCPDCARTYQRDAYQLVRAGLVGGKGVPETVATHGAQFVTFTAPSFGSVHTRAVSKHTCGNRRLCDCRPKPCHPGRASTCPHGVDAVCFARHEPSDPRLGQPLCLDCYDHDAQVVWNIQAGELWRRTTITITRTLRRIASRRGVDPDSVRVSFGKVAEMQRRGVAHFHAIIRLDGIDPDNPDLVIPPPADLDAQVLADAIRHAATTVRYATDPHPGGHPGWVIEWGSQLDIRPVNTGIDGAITDGMVAGYLAKYATKATEATGHTSRRITGDTIDIYADPAGTHTQRLVAAAWTLGTVPTAWGINAEWRRLRIWAHMLGFGGHFLSKSRRYSFTFRFLRDRRLIWRRTQTAGPPTDAPDEQPAVLVVNFLDFVGVGWHNTGDALLANTAAAQAREHRQIARDELTTALA